MLSDHIGLIILLAAGMLLSVFLKKLTVTAAITGGIIGLLVFISAEYRGIIVMASFFMLGTAATSWKIKTKQRLGFAETNKGKRTAAQVIANAGVAAILGLLVWLVPEQKDILVLMIAATFSSATADTLSSELGNIYGSNFYNIITFKKDQRGLNGVVSLEGTLIGLSGSIIIAMIYSAGTGWNTANAVIIIVAGTAGNLADSVIGATAERKNLLNNNGVNFLNTCIAAITGLLLHLLF
ncbi:hypothetical protein BH10BAC2_BH10BAC2_13250 [soil metagenome]